MHTMLAGRLQLEPRRLIMEEVPIPEPGPGEVRVAVKAAGVCLSDVHLLDGTLSPAFAPPSGVVTLGHEVAGVIDHVGPGVPAAWSVGRRVLLQAGEGCGACPACERGRSPCLRMRTRGVDYDGGWAPFALARHHTLVGLPDALPFEQAAIIPDAVSTPYAAVVATAGVRPAQSVGIWGVGGLGAHAVRVARLAGAAPIIALDPLPAARERALEFGADLALDPAERATVTRLYKATRDRGLDFAFDFAGVAAVREQAAKALALGGVMVLVGLTHEPLTIVNGTRFSYREHQVRGHYGSTMEHTEELVALTELGRLDLAPSISARIPLAEAPRAVQALIDRASAPVRLVLIP